MAKTTMYKSSTKLFLIRNSVNAHTLNPITTLLMAALLCLWSISFIAVLEPVSQPMWLLV